MELSRESLDALLERHQSTGESLGLCLVALGWPDEGDPFPPFCQLL